MMEDNMIIIPDGTPIKCDVCKNKVAQRNETEMIIRQVSIVHVKGNKIRVKCNKCKNMIDI